jgi:indoleamine 2,3-dioxygenase
MAYLTRGFLPIDDPLRTLPASFSAWDDLAARLPKILVGGQIRSVIEQMPPFDIARLQSEPEWERAMLILSFLGHAYVWGTTPVATQIPASLAVPWYAVATHLKRPPILSYASYALHNFQRLDTSGPVAIGNIALVQNFLGGIDEEWFILVHVEIEAKAAPALRALLPAQEAVAQRNDPLLISHLEQIGKSLTTICETLDRMPQSCDPYIYFTRVRPYIHGWKNNPALPEGIRYEGVDAYQGAPQLFRGETGAQSSIIPSLDAALAITHEDDPLRRYLMEMRDYMPEVDRLFIQKIESGPSVREYVLSRSKKTPALKARYNEAIDLIERFRSTHLLYADRYIHQQSQRSMSNPSGVGTGGTPFMTYLAKHKVETDRHRIS